MPWCSSCQPPGRALGLFPSPGNLFSPFTLSAFTRVQLVGSVLQNQPAFLPFFSPPDRSWLPCRKTGGNTGPGTQRGHLHPHAQPLLHGADKAAVKLVSGGTFWGACSPGRFLRVLFAASFFFFSPQCLRQHPQGRRDPHAGEGHVGHAHGQAAPVRRQLRPAAGGSRQGLGAVGARQLCSWLPRGVGREILRVLRFSCPPGCSRVVLWGGTEGK